MCKVLFALTLAATLVPFAVTQDNRVSPPVTMRDNTSAVSTQTGAAPTVQMDSLHHPPFCPPKTCLYYAGDYNGSWSGANGLLDADYTGGGLEGQTWVGVKPDRDVTVTGATFVLALSSGYSVTNPTPFAVQVGIKPGQAGKTICSTNGNATIIEYGYFQGQIPAYAYTVKKLSQSCKLKKGHTYYVNLLPTSTNGYGYVLNVPPDPANHYGWKNDRNHCYFNSPGFGDNYVTCDSQGAFSEFSIALTGEKQR